MDTIGIGKFNVYFTWIYMKIVFLSPKIDDMDIMIRENTQALIFDVDGTLAHSMPIHLECWDALGRNYGFRYTLEDLEKNAGKSGQEVVEIINERHGLSLDPDKMAYEKENLFLDHLDHVKPIEPVVRLLMDYYGKLPIAAGTGGFRNVATRMLQHIGVWDKIDVLVGSDDVAYHKPFPDTFLQCAEQLGVAPENCLVFEDAELGFQAAKAAGMDWIDVRPFYQKIQVIDTYNTDKKAKS